MKLLGETTLMPCEEGAASWSLSVLDPQNKPAAGDRSESHRCLQVQFPYSTATTLLVPLSDGSVVLD